MAHEIHRVTTVTRTGVTNIVETPDYDTGSALFADAAENNANEFALWVMFNDGRWNLQSRFQRQD